MVVGVPKFMTKMGHPTQTNADTGRVTLKLREQCVRMQDAPKIQTLMHAHYYLMANPRFWYEVALQQASMILCVLASDMREEARKAEAQVPG